jgi:hypothetical protein
MALEIQVLAWDMHKDIMVGLEPLLVSMSKFDHLASRTSLLDTNMNMDHSRIIPINFVYLFFKLVKLFILYSSPPGLL